MNPVELFEGEFMEWNYSPYARAVNNGSSAIFAGLLALGIPRGSYVITSPFTFPATANMIIAVGGIPLFCDIDKHSYLLDPEKVEIALANENISAIVIPQLFGKIADMDGFQDLRDRYGIPILEDASQALGAEYQGVRAGNFFDVGTYSFYATKNLWTYEGGMVVTPREEIAERVSLLRNHGMYGGEGGQMLLLGYNLKMPWICAFQGWQLLKMHKKAVLAELGSYGPEDHRDIYGRLVYQHLWYERNPGDWNKMDCPNAEELARRMRE